jgi:hypothetical protein
MTMTKRIYGSYAEAVVGRLEQVEKLPEVAARTYELRVLECPGISLALWLKGDQGAPDILLPLSLAAGEFHPDRPYSAEDEYRAANDQARIADQAALLERENDALIDHTMRGKTMSFISRFLICRRNRCC